MRRYRAVYQSMTARYDCGIFYADSKEEAEKEARASNNAFSANEKILIKCYESEE